jgi:hypothetical protein
MKAGPSDPSPGRKRHEHSTISHYVASLAVLGQYAPGATPGHPLPAVHGVILRRLWHQRLGQLAVAGCRYTQRRWHYALTCPGYLLGDRQPVVPDRLVERSCRLGRLCPYCRGVLAALTYDNAVTAQETYTRKWGQQTWWYLSRSSSELPSEVGRCTGTSSALSNDPRTEHRPLSLILTTCPVSSRPDSHYPGERRGAWRVPDSPVGLARAVARMHAYPSWLLWGPTGEVRDYLDSDLPPRARSTGCLRFPIRASSMASRAHKTFLPTRKPFQKPDAACATLEALKATLADYDHATEVRSRLRLPVETLVVVTSAVNASMAEFFQRPPWRLVRDAVNVITLGSAGYLVAVSPDLPVVTPVLFQTSPYCCWLPLSRLAATGQRAAPVSGAIWRNRDTYPWSSASPAPRPSTKPKKP